MPAKEVNNKPKRRLLDFDESDEESNEEDPMKAELKYVKMFFIVSFLSYRFKNEPSVDKDKDHVTSLGTESKNQNGNLRWHLPLGGGGGSRGGLVCH